MLFSLNELEIDIKVVDAVDGKWVLGTVRTLRWFTRKERFECFHEKKRKINDEIADTERKWRLEMVAEEVLYKNILIYQLMILVFTVRSWFISNLILRKSEWRRLWLKKSIFMAEYTAHVGNSVQATVDSVLGGCLLNYGNIIPVCVCMQCTEQQWHQDPGCRPTTGLLWPVLRTHPD